MNPTLIRQNLAPHASYCVDDFIPRDVMETALCIWEFLCANSRNDSPDKALRVAIETARDTLSGISGLRAFSVAWAHVLENVYIAGQDIGLSEFDVPFDLDIVPCAMRLEFASSCGWLLNPALDKTQAAHDLARALRGQA